MEDMNPPERENPRYGRMHPIDLSDESETYEVARRVLESYGLKPEYSQIEDLGNRIHDAASSINDERADAERLGTDIPSIPWSPASSSGPYPGS